ncbi:unnamed protein product [Cunninghamella blakesleeana]
MFNTTVSMNLFKWCKKKLRKITPKSKITSTTKSTLSIEEKYHQASSLSFSSSIVLERDVRQYNSTSPSLMPWTYRTGFSPNPDSLHNHTTIAS